VAGKVIQPAKISFHHFIVRQFSNLKIPTSTALKSQNCPVAKLQNSFARVTLPDMNTANQPNVKFVQTPDYREAYSNSVQIRVNVWDFFLVFGTMQQSTETQVELRNFQGIYLSPQQAKALMALLQQNVANYESAFGEIKLDPRAPVGPVH
jgi:hypothetical protein